MKTAEATLIVRWTLSRSGIEVARMIIARLTPVIIAGLISDVTMWNATIVAQLIDRKLLSDETIIPGLMGGTERLDEYMDYHGTFASAVYDNLADDCKSMSIVDPVKNARRMFWLPASALTSPFTDDEFYAVMFPESSEDDATLACRHWNNGYQYSDSFWQKRCLKKQVRLLMKWHREGRFYMQM